MLKFYLFFVVILDDIIEFYLIVEVKCIFIFKYEKIIEESVLFLKSVNDFLKFEKLYDLLNLEGFMLFLLMCL